MLSLTWYEVLEEGEVSEDEILVVLQSIYFMDFLRFGIVLICD